MIFIVTMRFFHIQCLIERFVKKRFKVFDDFTVMLENPNKNTGESSALCDVINSKVRHLSAFNLSKDQNKSYDYFSIV